MKRHSLYFHDGQAASDAENTIARDYEDYEDLELFNERRERYQWRVSFSSEKRIGQRTIKAIGQATAPNAIAFNSEDED